MWKNRHQRESEGDESQMNGLTEAEPAGQRETEQQTEQNHSILCGWSRVVVKVIAATKKSFLYRLISPSVHFSVMKTASDTHYVKGDTETSPSF